LLACNSPAAHQSGGRFILLCDRQQAETDYRLAKPPGILHTGNKARWAGKNKEGRGGWIFRSIC
jgi:hypothetical protein